MNILSTLLLAATLTAASSLSMAADINHGKSLHQANCTSCHDDSIYTRKDRRINTRGALDLQIRHCEQALSLQWFDEDVDDVAAYLNDSYYKFK